MKPRVWVLSELYYPDETATGYLLTAIAEGLARFFDVHVLCGRLPYAGKRNVADRRNDVRIRRCFATSLNKDVLTFRLINLVVVSVSIFWNSVRSIRRAECVLVVTNPPALPFLAALACWIRRARCLLLIHDVYPEVLIATGLAKKESISMRFLGWLNALLYMKVDKIIVLGRDMKSLVLKKLDHSDHSVVIIPNWADLRNVVPSDRNSNCLLVKLGLLDKFVIQYAGNIGRTHGIEILLECARRLKDIDRVHLLFIGTGAKLSWLKSAVEASGYRNVTVLPPQPRAKQNDFLNACDVAIISFVPGMAGISVPSRMYNILAAGKPIIAVSDIDSELARVVQEENVGWVVPPNQPDQLVRTIVEAMDKPSLTSRMAVNARTAAERKYSFEDAIGSYQELIKSVQHDSVGKSFRLAVPENNNRRRPDSMKIERKDRSTG